jgi:hypothetical protein
MSAPRYRNSDSSSFRSCWASFATQEACSATWLVTAVMHAEAAKRRMGIEPRLPRPSQHDTELERSAEPPKFWRLPVSLPNLGSLPSSAEPPKFYRDTKRHVEQMLMALPYIGGSGSPPYLGPATPAGLGRSHEPDRFGGQCVGPLGTRVSPPHCSHSDSEQGCPRPGSENRCPESGCSQCDEINTRSPLRAAASESRIHQAGQQPGLGFGEPVSSRVHLPLRESVRRAVAVGRPFESEGGPGHSVFDAVGYPRRPSAGPT